MYPLSHTQAVDLPEGVWFAVSQYMLAKEWANACKTCSASYRLKMPVVVAEVRDELSKDEQVFMRQLQLDRWHGCHSLCLNLRQLSEAAKLTSEQIKMIRQASNELPFLRCLHIIGRPQVPLTKDSLEGMLMSFLAKRLSVLTLHVNAVMMPLDMPLLQHLVLELGTTTGLKFNFDEEVGYESHLLNDLKGLTTLCLKAERGVILDALDLRGCVHLRHVAVQGVRFQEDSLALPAGCQLQIISEAMDSSVYLHAIASKVTELIMCHMSHRITYSWFSYEWVLRYASTMSNLKQLRINLNGKDSQKAYEVKGEFCVVIPPGTLPTLEVLELGLHCNLMVKIPSEIKLKTLVLIAAGTLRLHGLKLGISPVTTLKHLYLQLRAPFGPRSISILRDSYGKNLRLLQSVKDKRYIAQVPTSFRPNNLEECCCNACPQCLARGGVPILCEHIWRSEGFDKNLRAH